MNEIMTRFLSNTDETGRFIVTSQRTGKRYAVEPIGDPHIEWGSVDPSNGLNGKLMHKKGDGKYRGSVDECNSLINEANGFKNVITLDPGTSPMAYIDMVDAQYPSI